MRRSNATTLQDVAREAGVSTITASVVLNGSRTATRVSEATRQRIEEVGRRLNYRANGVARALNRRRMDNIGVVGEIPSDGVNLYFFDVLTGIIGAAARFNQNTTVLPIVNWETSDEAILNFCDGRIDGVILVAPTAITQDFADKLLHHAPYVLIHGNGVPPNTDDLDVDNEGGAFTATKYLIDLGHRRIAHFAGPTTFLGPRQRLDGYKKALESERIPFDESLVYPGDFTAESGAERAKQLLASGNRSDMPTAVFCVNDFVAAGLLEVMHERGVSVPGDLSIVGFDDAALARMVLPQITTIRQPLSGMGSHAVERLMFRIDESLRHKLEAKQPVSSSVNEAPADEYEQPHMEIFPFELIVRGSTAPPNR